MLNNNGYVTAVCIAFQYTLHRTKIEFFSVDGGTLICTGPGLPGLKGILGNLFIML